MTNAIPEAVLKQHSAFLGKTGSGKTSTAKLAVEQILRNDPNARACILDPTKSDWWGLTSSSDGRQPGLPFCILGGPRGHVPLHQSAGKVIGELVGTGALPLSIIDMADFPAGGLQEFFNEFAPALMRKMRGVVYLIIEEAHEFAPKERAGFGAENMAIHFAKKLATAGRSKGIRLMLITQRTQSLHNALLGSCDTMIAHRLTAPADQEPVKKWLKANVDRETFEKVSASMSSLKTGSGWICSGEAQVAELVQFPKISTYDNSATPTGEMTEHDVKTAPVDRDRLRSIIGDAVKEAAEDDPKALRAEIARLKASTSIPQDIPADPAVIQAARDEAYASGLWDGMHQFLKAFGRLQELQHLAGEIAMRADDAVQGLQSAANHAPAHANELRNHRLPPGYAITTAPVARALPAAAPEPARSARTSDGPLGGVQQKILNSVAEMEALCKRAPPRVLVAMTAGYKNVKSTGFAKALSALSTDGLVAYPDSGAVSLTAEGRKMARPRHNAMTTAEVQARVVEMLGGTAGKILGHLVTVYPGVLDRTVLADRSGYENVKSTGFAKALSRLSSLGFVTYPSSGTAKAGGILFP